MLKQASVDQVRRGELTRKDGYLVITMRFYPRGLRKALRDEYRADLAPDPALFKDFKRWQLRLGHEAAFERSRYEKRFFLGERALETLERLAVRSRRRDVYLICQCEVGERCHREILLRIAQKRFGAKIGKVHHSYPNVRSLVL
jgi:uncharacterized protein YeaO (DUF488 family)